MQPVIASSSFMKRKQHRCLLLLWKRRVTAAYTFQKRREKRNQMARRLSEKRWNKMEKAV